MTQERSADGSDSTVSGGPLLALLARGLEIWLRQQCQSIAEVEIHLEGSATQLLRGHLAGVRLVAREVVYQDMRLEGVSLRSDAIRIRMGPLLRRQTVELENGFSIRGEVSFLGEGLDLSLRSDPWRPLGDGLAEALLDRPHLGGLRIDGERLVLHADDEGGEPATQREAGIRAVADTVEVFTCDETHSLRLPMDPNIRILSTRLSEGVLEIRGEASVTP